MRLNRFLARSGVASRRKAEELILAGKVKVNGKVVKELSTDISDDDKVHLDNQQVTLPQLKYFLLNKPKGYTVTKEDKFAEKLVFDLLPEIPGLIAVGRLDKDTEGLLLITNDGEFAQNIIHPTNKIEKEYIVKTKTEIKDSDLTDLTSGVALEDGMATAIKAIKNNPMEMVLVITEGRNRQVRRMIEATGNQVTELKRIRVGDIKLDVEPGEYRELTEEEVRDYV